jgi:glycosyltransferase involved in cell wall biosynthesis
MIEIFILLFSIILIDGLKSIIESFSKYDNKTKSINYSNNITAIVAAHNEESIIANTIKSIASAIPEENIIIIDDDSSDNTVSVINKCGFKGLLLKVEHMGKAKAIQHALDFAKTKYTLLLDADVMLSSNFEIPIDFINDKATAVAFNIIPSSSAITSVWRKFLLNLQKHEYAKSMHIGRKFHNATKSVHCISGAAGLFKTERLVEFTKMHTGIFPGEDLERTLIELNADSKIIFSDYVIQTDVPITFRALSKQRIFGWWPGLWRNLYLFVKLFVKKHTPTRLKYEMLYEIFSVITDPLKLVALYVLIITGGWDKLLYLYFAYLAFELVISYRILIMSEDYLEQIVPVMFVYPIYSILQMFYRLIAFFVFFYKKVISREWSKALAVISLMLLPSFVLCQEKPLWTVSPSYSYVQDDVNSRTYKHYDAYVGFKNCYIDGTYGAWKAITVGTYLPNFQGSVRIRDNDVMPTVYAERWFGNWVPNVAYSHVWIYKADEFQKQNYPVISGGISYYYFNVNDISANIVKEFGRSYGLTGIVKAHSNLRNHFWNNTCVSVNNVNGYSLSETFGYRIIYVSVEYYKNYDFNNFDRMFLTAGLIFKF